MNNKYVRIGQNSNEAKESILIGETSQCNRLIEKSQNVSVTSARM